MLDSGDSKNDYLEFKKVYFVSALNEHALKKSKIFRGNHELHINKILPNAIAICFF